MAHPRKLIGLQWLRGVAALLVLMAHSHDVLQKGYGVELYDGWIGGIGVDIFFVISGFIMFSVMDGQPAGRTSATGFAARRIGRILPIYWVMTAGVIVAWVVTGADMFSYLDENHQISRVLMNYSFLDRHPIVTVGWTLCFGMMFYALSSIVLLAFSTQAVRLAVTTLILIIMVMVRWSTNLAWFWPGEYVVLEFAVGGLIWFLNHHYAKSSMTSMGLSAILAGLIVIGMCLKRHDYNHGHPFWVLASARGQRSFAC